MPHDVARKHRRHEVMVEVEVGTADGAARHLDDGVSRILDLGIGHRVVANVFLAVPDEGFHGVLPNRRARLRSFSGSTSPGSKVHEDFAAVTPGCRTGAATCHRVSSDSIPTVSRTTYSGRCLVSVRIRPTYSPSTPKEISWMPPRNSTEVMIEA